MTRGTSHRGRVGAQVSRERTDGVVGIVKERHVLAQDRSEQVYPEPSCELLANDGEHPALDTREAP